jgi:hypothetical protein
MPDADGTHLGWGTMRKRAWRTWATNELDLRAAGNPPDPEQLVHLNPIEELTDRQLRAVARTGVMPENTQAEIEHARIPQRVGRLLAHADVGVPKTRARTLTKLGSSGNLEAVSKDVHAVLDQEAKKTGTPRNPTLPASIDDRIDFPLGSASNQEISDIVDATRDAVRRRGVRLQDTDAGNKLRTILTTEKARRGASATWTVPD